MDHPRATARVVRPGELEGRALTAVLDRAAIEEAVRSEEPDELLLDIARRSNGDVEAHVVRVDVNREDLERFLSDAEGDAVALAFDRDELDELLDTDVEGHGLRERALVLSVATVAAVGAAGGAAAAVPSEGGGGPAPFGAVAASGEESPAAVIGGAGAEQAPFGAVAASGEESPAATIGGAGAEQAPFGAVAASGEESPAAVIGGAGAEQAPSASPVAAAPDSPDPAVVAGVAGGLGALAITAAAFARRRREPRPA